MAAIKSPVTGVVWKLVAKAGDTLAAGDTVMLLESMKMEIPVEMPADGRVTAIRVAENASVKQGQLLAEYE